jgi:hypothetical protein
LSSKLIIKQLRTNEISTKVNPYVVALSGCGLSSRNSHQTNAHYLSGRKKCVKTGEIKDSREDDDTPRRKERGGLKKIYDSQENFHIDMLM